jgi:hypothetical protein
MWLLFPFFANNATLQQMFYLAFGTYVVGWIIRAIFIIGILIVVKKEYDKWRS